MKKKLCLAFVFLIAFKSFSQDPVYKNAQQSLIALNPSFAGSNGFIRNQAVYRNQWPNLSGTYQTYYSALDGYIKPIRGGISFSASHDDEAHGTLTTDVLSLAYAQHISFLEGKLKIIPSLQGSVGVVRLDLTKLNFGDQIDPRRGFVWYIQQATPASKKTYYDLSAGLLINYKNFYFGTSVFHVNQPDEGLLGKSKLPYRLSIHSSYNLHFSEKTLLNFFARYEQQQNFSYLHFNVSAVIFKHLILNAGYASNDAFNFGFGYRNNFFVLAAGYDVTISKLSGNTAGSWELHASFNLRNKEKRKVLTNFETW